MLILVNQKFFNSSKESSLHHEIAMLNFADDMNIICDKNINYNERLDNLDNWLSQLLFKINPTKSKGILLPKRSKIKRPALKGFKIPLEF